MMRSILAMFVAGGLRANSALAAGTRLAFYPELRGRIDRFMHLYRSPD